MTDLKKLDEMFISVDPEKVKDRLIEDKPFRGNRTPAVWVTFKDSETEEVRILPAWTTEGPYAYLPYIKIYQHWDVGPNQKRVICPHMMSDKKDPCYVCEQIAALYKTGDKTDEARAKKMRAGQSFIYQVIDANDPFWVEKDQEVRDKPEILGRPKIKFMRLPYRAHSQLLGFYNDPDYHDLSHYLKGHYLRITRTGRGFDTEYDIKARPQKTPIFGEAEDPDVESITMVLQDLSQLDQHPFFQVATYDETVAHFLGEDPPKRVSSTSLPAGVSESKGSLPPAGGIVADEDDGLAAWIAQGRKTWLDGKSGVARSKQEVADAFGVPVNKISDCYGEQADHEVVGCQNCPINTPCICTYKTKYGRWSESQEEVTEEQGAGMIGRPAAAPSSMSQMPDNSPAVSPHGGDDDMQAMEDFLKGHGG